MYLYCCYISYTCFKHTHTKKQFSHYIAAAYFPLLCISENIIGQQKKKNKQKKHWIFYIRIVDYSWMWTRQNDFLTKKIISKWPIITKSINTFWYVIWLGRIYTACASTHGENDGGVHTDRTEYGHEIEDVQSTRKAKMANLLILLTFVYVLFL